MTPRNRSSDLTADLLHDLEAEQAAPTAAGRSVPEPAPAPSLDRTAPAPIVEASLYLSLRAWQRPTLGRAGGSVSVGAGPVLIRIGRRTS